MVKDIFIATVLTLWENYLKLKAMLGSKSAKKALNFIAQQNAKREAFLVGLDALDHQLNEGLWDLIKAAEDCLNQDQKRKGLDYQSMYLGCLKKQRIHKVWLVLLL